MWRRWRLLTVLLLAGCARPGPSQPPLTRDQLLDPESCRTCHPSAYAQWSGSMHAYASDDPVFRAMNARGQRETGGRLGSFCLNCHAPMAVREGATTDGKNLDQLPRRLHGVTCYFCHTVDAVEGTHNNPLRLAQDGVMRGGLADPLGHDSHGSIWSQLHDRNRLASSAMCGSCHDVTNEHGLALEHTFAEWQQSVFSRPTGGASCGQCHMPQSSALQPASTLPGSPLRRLHDHSMPGVDLALTPFPDAERQRELVIRELAGSLQSAICVLPQGESSRVMLVLDNAGAGHAFPSGAVFDRRFWAEVVAEREGRVVYSSGVVPAGESPASLADPDLWLVRDCLYGDEGQEVHQFWEAVSGRSNALPVLETLDRTDPRFYQRHRAFFYPGRGRGMTAQPDAVRVQLWIQPVGVDVLDLLIESGDLDAAVRQRMPTLPVGGLLEWRTGDPSTTWTDPATGDEWSCVTTTNLDVRSMAVVAESHAVCPPTP